MALLVSVLDKRLKLTSVSKILLLLSNKNSFPSSPGLRLLYLLLPSLELLFFLAYTSLLEDF